MLLGSLSKRRKEKEREDKRKSQKDKRQKVMQYMMKNHKSSN